MPYTVAAFPPELYQSPIREIALRDFLTRKFDRMAYEVSGRRGTGKSGMVAITKMGQEVLERTSVYLANIDPPAPKVVSPGSNPALQRGKPIKLKNNPQKGVEVRLIAGLPANGRRILGRQAAEMLCDDMPYIVHRSLKYEQLDAAACRRHVETVEDADFLRKQLVEKNLVAFVANGAMLPRRSGVDARPLSSENVVPFQSPPSLEVEFECPNQGKISGMGISKGVTLIVGGGYHGKSTLLKAIELGVYNHIPGDGREFVVTDPTAVKIRAEDGRSVAGVDISPFINQLPQERSTTQFTTENASGSTSQAANIMEALEIGIKNDKPEEVATTAPILLVDEDTAATNFMIRDRRMQELISKEGEPITPFIDKVRQLYTDYQVSTILVMGGSGDYFEVADKIIAMENYQAKEVTEKAKEIAEKYVTGRTSEGGENFGEIRGRIPLSESLDPVGDDEMCV